MEGRPYSEVAEILKTARKGEHDGETHYYWVFNCENNGHRDGFILIVIIHEDTSTQKGKVVKTAYRTTLPS